MDGPFTLLRELPNRPTQRSCKLSTELDAIAKDQDQNCFSGPSTDQQLALGSFHNSWEELLGTMQELQHQTMAGALQQLQQWAAQSAGRVWQQQADRPSSSSHQQNHQLQPDTSDLLPTVALSLASSTNTAQAYANLLCTLKQQGHHTALITARDAGAGLAAVINSAMRQFLGAPSAADDMPALLAWWQDEAQRSAAAQSSSKHGGPPASTPAKAGPSHAGAAAGTPAATPSRQLRARAGAATPAGKTPGVHGQQAAAAPQLQVPVLVLQDSDSVDAEALEELVVALHEARRAGLPLVLVLGITSSHHGLLQLLPNSTLRRIQLLQLSLPPAWQQLARFYGAVLLAGPQPRVVLGPSCASWLLQHFRDVDSSASMAQRAMQLACVEHHLQQPLSCLAEAAASGSRKKLQAAIRRLPQGQLLRCFSALLASSAQQAPAGRVRATLPAQEGAAAGHATAEAWAAQQAALAHLQAAVDSKGARRGQDAAAAAASGLLEGAVWGAMTSFQQWRVGLLLLNLVAKFTGNAEVDASFQLPALYSSAQQASFLTTSRRGLPSTCSSLLLKLLGATSSSSTGGGWPVKAGVVPVSRLDDAECVELLQKLLQLLAAAQQGGSSDGAAAAAAAGAGGDVGRNSEQDGGSGSDSDDSASSTDADSSSDDDSSGSDTGTDTRGAADNRRRSKQRALETALGSSRQIQQLSSALQALHAAAATSAAAAANAAGASTGAKQRGSRRQQQPQQHSNQQAALHQFCSDFAAVLAPLPEQLQLSAPAAAAAAAAAADTDAGDGPVDMDCADAAAMGLCSTPVGAKRSSRGGSSVHTPLPTPGGLASQLRKQVRFAPDTPDHAKVKARGASSSAKSTPDDPAAPGLIKTPNHKRGGSTAQKKPRNLFGAQAAAAAAAAAAGSSNPQRRSKREKQEAAVGDIAGSSAAALAAVAAGGAAAAGAMGNKRHARLAGMFGASGAAAAAGSSGKGSPAPASKAPQQAAGLLFSPTAGSPGSAAAAGSSPDSATGSPAAPAAASRLHNSSNASTPAAAAAAAAGSGGMLSPARGRGRAGGSRARSSSRLSRQTDAAPAAAPAAVGAISDAAGDVDMQTEAAAGEAAQQGQQQGWDQDAEMAQAGVATATAAAPASSFGQALAQLLAAAIPRLLLDWSHPSSSDSNLHRDLSSSILQGGSSAERAAAVAAGASLAAAGAAAFTFDDVAALERHLAPAAPATVHTALVAPALRLRGHPSALAEQGWEDSSLAYVLLQQQRDDGMPVSDWFGLFCESLQLRGFQAATDSTVAGAIAAAATGGIGGSAREEGGGALGGGAGGVVGAAAGRALRSRARTGKKARGYADAREAAASEDPAAAVATRGGSGLTPSKRPRQQQDQDQDQDRAAPAGGQKAGRKRGSSAVAGQGGSGAAGQQQEEVDQQELLSAAARFSQAAAELQLLGVWKGTKRRRAAGVLRVFAPEGPALPSMAAAAAALAGDGDVDDGAQACAM